MSLVNYLNFDHQAKEAIQFYQKVFETEQPHIITYGEFNDPSYQAPDHIKDLVMHCEMHMLGDRLMISDTPRGFGFDFIAGNNVTVAVVLKDSKALKTYFDRLSVRGKIITPFEKTSFSEGYGYVYDQFGIGWQLITE